MCQVCNPTRVWHPSAWLGVLPIAAYLGAAWWFGHRLGVW